MHKDFDSWNIVKKNTEDGRRAPVKLGEVYWCKIGLNIGVELDGKNNQYLRPVLIIKKYSNEIVFCVPLTTKKHSGDWYYHLPHFGINSYAILNQARPMDTKRLLSSLGQISEIEIKKIIDTFYKLLKS